MTMVMRGAALSGTDLARGSLLDLAEDTPAMLAELDLAATHGRDSSVLDLDGLAAPASFLGLAP